MKNILKRS